MAVVGELMVVLSQCSRMVPTDSVRVLAGHKLAFICFEVAGPTLFDKANIVDTFAWEVAPVESGWQVWGAPDQTELLQAVAVPLPVGPAAGEA
jgi:hypothetical protein